MSKKYDELIRKTSKDGISLRIDPQKVIPMSLEESDFNKIWTRCRFIKRVKRQSNYKFCEISYKKQH